MRHVDDGDAEPAEEPTTPEPTPEPTEEELEERENLRRRERNKKIWGQVKYWMGVLWLILLLVGTVNMDESTHGFSRKVLDRAFTLEFSRVELAEWRRPPVKLPERATAWKAESQRWCIDFLDGNLENPNFQIVLRLG